MANQRHRRLMQEALDDALSIEARQELFAQLDSAPEDAEVFTRLKQVDRLLRAAPLEPSPDPERFVMKLMRRLAEGVQVQPLSQTAGLALSLSLALLALLLMPLLAALGWIILNNVGNAAALSALLKSLSDLLIFLMNGLETLVQSARDLVQAYPQGSVVVVALIPLALLWLARYVGQERNAGASER